jgi:hypothetical protein
MIDDMEERETKKRGLLKDNLVLRKIRTSSSIVQDVTS